METPFSRRAWRTRHTQDEAFTLIELLVVMIIIGILAAIAVPTFMNQQGVTRDTQVISDVKNLATEITTLLVEEPDAEVFGISNPQNGKADLQVDQYTSLINVTSGTQLNIAPGQVPGSFLICGWHDKAKRYNKAAPVYDSTTGGIVRDAYVPTTDCNGYGGIDPNHPQAWKPTRDANNAPQFLSYSAAVQATETSGGNSLPPVGDGNGNGNGDSNGNGNGEGNGGGGSLDPTPTPTIEGQLPGANPGDKTWFPYATQQQSIGGILFSTITTDVVARADEYIPHSPDFRINRHSGMRRMNRFNWSINAPGVRIQPLYPFQSTTTTTAHFLDDDGNILNTQVISGVNESNSNAYYVPDFEANPTAPRIGMMIDLQARVNGTTLTVIKVYYEAANPNYSK